MNKILQLLFVLLLFAFHPPTFAGLNDGLVAYWSFDDCSAKDDSGNGHDGVINGSPQCVDGTKGKAFSFNGVDDLIRVTNPFPINLANTSPLTISIWLKTETNKLAAGIFTQHTACVGSPADHFSDDHFSLTLYGSENPNRTTIDGHIFMAAEIGTNRDIVANNKWHHVVLKYDGKSTHLYVDGIQKDMQSDSPKYNFDSSIDLVIGGFHINSCGQNHNFEGNLDEARIYNRALTDSEVAELYAQGTMPASNIMGSLCLANDKNHATDLTKVMEVNVANELVFAKSVDVVSNYRTLLVQTDAANKTASKLYNKVRYLKQKGDKSIAETLGSISTKDGKAWNNYLKSAKVFYDFNKLSPKKDKALKQYVSLKKKIELKPSSIHKAGAIAGGALTLYSTACGIYEIAEDINTLIDGNDIAYDTLQLSWDSINLFSDGLSLYELITNVKAGSFSQTLSKTNALLLIPQIVSIGYEWARDNTIYDQLDSILKTHSSHLESRYFIVDQVVDKLVNFKQGQPIDDLRGAIYNSLNNYPNVYRLDGTVFNLANGFVKYLNNSAFLQKNFNKLKYQDLTPPELASVAAIYVLGESALWEDMELENTAIANLTKTPTLSDFIAGGFGGKDSYQVFKDVRAEIFDALDYDAREDLRYRFDSIFYQKHLAILRQIGAKIHYYEDN